MVTSAPRSYEAQEAEFFRNRGYTNAGIAGALGNLQKESDFSPTAYNPNEGAIGIAQWENGRRTNLDTTASELHVPETNINAQLAYMGQELSGSFANVDQYMKTATDPNAAANEWNRHFEISGDYSQDRENNAAAIYNQLSSNAPLTGGGNDVSSQIADFPLPGPIYPGNDPSSSGLPGNPISGVGNAISGLANAFSAFGTVFQKILWIFNLNHFIRFMLYVFGAVAVMIGLGMITFGAKHGETE